MLVLVNIVGQPGSSQPVPCGLRPLAIAARYPDTEELLAQRAKVFPLNPFPGARSQLGRGFRMAFVEIRSGSTCPSFQRVVLGPPSLQQVVRLVFFHYNREHSSDRIKELVDRVTHLLGGQPRLVQMGFRLTVALLIARFRFRRGTRTRRLQSLPVRQRTRYQTTHIALRKRTASSRRQTLEAALCRVGHRPVPPLRRVFTATGRTAPASTARPSRTGRRCSGTR